MVFPPISLDPGMGLPRPNRAFWRLRFRGRRRRAAGLGAPGGGRDVAQRRQPAGAAAALRNPAVDGTLMGFNGILWDFNGI